MSFIKRLYKRIKKFKERNKIEYEIGDIIWAKKYDNKVEMESIPKGHREGPYIIVDKKGRMYKCLACCSKNNNKIIRYKIDKYKYQLCTDLYVNISNINKLSRKRVIKKVDNLDMEDFNYLYKLLFIMDNKHSLNMDINNIKFKFNYEIGDIILYYNQLIYIYNKDNAYLYGYIVKRVKDNQKGVYINGSKYMFLVQNIKKIPDDINITLFDIARFEDIKGINKFVEKEKKAMQNKKILNRGKLVEYKNNIYYIYGEYKECLLLYKIYIMNQDVKDKIKIKINDDFYYTLFEEEKISKYKKVKIKKIANDDEMMQISKQKKIFTISKKNNEREIAIRCKRYKEGKIIADKNTLERYLIIRKEGNKIVYMSLEDNMYYVHDFSQCLDFKFIVIEDMDVYKFQEISKVYSLKHL